uniref:BTB domain-containing protein n=1 Tax=Eptatretus burgeri TaxID=7764 RepID=A0A8C4NAC2_EPTBU
MGATASRAPPNSTEHDVLESLGRRTYIGTMGAGEFSQEGRQLSLGSKTPVAQGGNRKRRATALTVAASGLAALRRRLTRRRRSLSRKSGQGRAFREILLGWDVHSVHALLEEYRAIAALKQLYIQVARARPSTCDLAADFKELASSGSCSDVVLIFCGARFPAHRAILAARCPRLQPQLSTLSLDHNAELRLDLQLPDSITDSASFAVFLQHIYCGSVEVAVSADTNLLRHLSKEFPISSLPDTGYQVLLSGACYPYDSVLAFSASSEGADMPAALELPCHGAVLAARSPFFRAALERMLRAAQGVKVPTLPTRIVLDQTVLPGRYGRSLLHFLYTDCLELHLVEAGPVGLGFDRLGSLREVQAMVSGVSTCHNMEQAMELCHIARLLEIDILVQACEDELVAMLSIERLPSLLAWSGRGHGSEWVHRQALLFLCEEFSSIATSPALFQLSQDALLEALGSEYTQASEADILKAVVRWGEHQLLKRMDERETKCIEWHSTQYGTQECKAS